MDCLVAMPGDRGSSWHSSPGFSGLPVAQTPPACVVGSPLVRSTMFLPRLCSIPEAAEHSSAACDESAYAADTALAAALTAGCAPGSSSSFGGSPKPSAADAAVVDLAQCSSSAQQETSRDDCSSQQISGCSSKLSGDSVQEAACCSSARVDEGTNSSEGVMQDLSPAVVASTWAISIRHFQDCLPISADSVCSSSTCHTVSMRGSGDAAAGVSSSQAPCFLQEPSSSNSQQQQDTQGLHISQAGQQAASSCSVPHSSSSSSLLPAADDDGSGPSAASLLAALSMPDMDPTEWQPWDRVAKWLDTHGAEGSQLTGTTSSSSGQACSSSSLQGMDGLQPSTTQQQQQEARQQSQQDGSNDAEPLFDAPDWWQESVRARLEEQREAFQSSWWCRLKMLTGLAAQRAASSL